MKLHDLRPAPGSVKPRKRRGRGDASGHGTYAGRGRKGQGARSGGGKGPYFEGGQLPLVRRMPVKRGFTNIFRVEYQPVNVGRLAALFEAGQEITLEALHNRGAIRSLRKPVKILGNGDVDVPLRVSAHAFSASAREKIEAAGGTVEVLPSGVGND
ncbi:MAG: 50S ribosomal protein L15 [Chloroflexi bacterium]|nr:50S ribosomal protein L15 [Chloroflexota bacterium]